MKVHKTRFTIESMCKVFKVSRSGYYQSLNRVTSPRSIENIKLLKEIKIIYEASKKTYGSPRVTAELKSRGFQVSRPKVARMMRRENIRSIVKKKYVVTTNSKHSFEFSPNLLKRGFIVSNPGQFWVSDLTYIKTKEGWLYLTIIIDLYDRKVIGWSFSVSLEASQTVIPAFKMAIKNRIIIGSLMFHSDRGVQYCCNEFRNLLKQNNVVQSMSRKGNCWDNAVSESFFKSLKTERVYHKNYNTRKIAELDLFEYIEVWYNRKRRHSFLGYLTPLEIENYYFKNLAA
jgi:putative transposase